MAAPKLVLVDPGGSQRGEAFRVPELTLDQDVSSPARISFTMDQNDKLVQFVEERRSRFKLYRSGVLQGNYRVWTCKDAFSGADGRLEVSAVDDAYVAFSKRTLQVDTDFTAIDKSLIVKALIDTQNARAVTTGIRTDTVALPTVGDATIEWPIDKPVGEAISELAGSTPEFEWRIAPIEANSGFTGDLILASQLGFSNLEVFFEFGPGTKESIQGFGREGDADHYASHVHLIGAGEGAGLFRSDVSDDALAIAQGILVDRVFTATDIANQSLLDGGATELASQTVDTRRPLMLEIAQTYDKVPFDDYGVGDFISARIKKGRVDVTGSIRIWGMTVVWTSDGQERVTVRIEDEATGS